MTDLFLSIPADPHPHSHKSSSPIADPRRGDLVMPAQDRSDSGGVSLRSRRSSVVRDPLMIDVKNGKEYPENRIAAAEELLLKNKREGLEAFSILLRDYAHLGVIFGGVIKKLLEKVPGDCATVIVDVIVTEKGIHQLVQALVELKDQADIESVYAHILSNEIAKEKILKSIGKHWFNKKNKLLLPEIFIKALISEKCVLPSDRLNAIKLTKHLSMDTFKECIYIFCKTDFLIADHINQFIQYCNRCEEDQKELLINIFKTIGCDTQIERFIRMRMLDFLNRIRLNRLSKDAEDDVLKSLIDNSFYEDENSKGYIKKIKEKGLSSVLGEVCYNDFRDSGLELGRRLRAYMNVPDECRGSLDETFFIENCLIDFLKDLENYNEASLQDFFETLDKLLRGTRDLDKKCPIDCLKFIVQHCFNQPFTGNNKRLRLALEKMLIEIAVGHPHACSKAVREYVLWVLNSIDGHDEIRDYYQTQSSQQLKLLEFSFLKNIHLAVDVPLPANDVSQDEWRILKEYFIPSIVQSSFAHDVTAIKRTCDFVNLVVGEEDGDRGCVLKRRLYGFFGCLLTLSSDMQCECIKMAVDGSMECVDHAFGQLDRMFSYVLFELNKNNPNALFTLTIRDYIFHKIEEVSRSQKQNNQEDEEVYVLNVARLIGKGGKCFSSIVSQLDEPVFPEVGLCSSAHTTIELFWQSVSGEDLIAYALRHPWSKWRMYHEPIFLDARENVIQEAFKEIVASVSDGKPYAELGLQISFEQTRSDIQIQWQDKLREAFCSELKENGFYL